MEFNKERMIYSMTGYGRVVKDIPGKKITIEIKALNSKQFDLNTRIPGYYREKELEIRNKIAKILLRGKIDFSMYVELAEGQTNTTINASAYKTYYKQLSDIYKSMNVNMPEEAIEGLIKLPDVLSATHEDLNDEEWRQIDRIIDKVLEKCVNYRLQEGRAMHKDLIERIEIIDKLLKKIEPIERQRIEQIKSRIRSKLDDFIDPDRVDESRFEQELIYFLDKLDVNEEMVRLENHCKYFIKTMDENEAIGKKLGFISQEIGREINTLGSKANNTQMQKLVVGMKNQLEKIKEQSLNIL